ncbi:hypothetical protein HAX54_014309, partial [Datura stramonium]|nr:hypothetical protein [Datura stramonium]
VVVHEELSHPVYSATTSPIIEELNGAVFHVVEIMQTAKVRGKMESNGVKISKIAKMVASEKLKYNYQPKTRLKVKSDGIIESIQLKHQNNTFGLGYEPTVGRACNMQSKKKVFISKRVSASA